MKEILMQLLTFYKNFFFANKQNMTNSTSLVLLPISIINFIIYFSITARLSFLSSLTHNLLPSLILQFQFANIHKIEDNKKGYSSILIRKKGAKIDKK